MKTEMFTRLFLQINTGLYIIIFDGMQLEGGIYGKSSVYDARMQKGYDR